ncbi:NAD-dependent epimerase/dehydratase family protein [Verrucosispora sp. WMMA2044]|uniref:NAD-dependent epimerase/dehydratase family protein n=1 Tax=unclassified Micromonospora TaxID=2617518 RepID=UPI001B3989DB|nr:MULTISPECIES: NAD-dependent epimerase/dehydratase family protein [unclassified Micromonospora]MBQ1050792.1 NAD-dependent epimerase/dehydratase family protein [Micromonospora sp. C51]WBB46825.1 NAD-dependent epimerase/dehydratase family protein [Verrucosispora sp. WMMA2044]
MSKILVLGGTRFIGRHIVEQCITRDDEITLLYRGRSPSPFSGIARHVLTDRRAPTAEAATVLAEPWDAVIDTSAQDLDDLRPVLPLLTDVGRYVLISSCGVYRRDLGRNGLSERSPTIPADASHPVRASATRKLRCERYLERRLARLAIPLLIVRLGLVIGRHDDSERLAYWLERALRGGDVLVPMPDRQPLQLVDATDVARFIRTAAEQQMTGIVNVAGPTTTARVLVDTVLTHAGRAVTPCRVGEEFALAHGIRPWTEIPLWLPATSAELALMSVNTNRAVRAGLTHRSLSDSIAEALTWQALRRRWSQRWLDRTREQLLLRKWRG